MTPRTVSWFSCGAASAIATKMVLNSGTPNVTVAYAYVREEHEDNMRFLADCEKWFGVPILILSNHKYNASTFTVYEKERYLVGPSGAACTRLLKKEVREGFQRPDDIHVFGYHVGEESRVDRFIDANNTTRISTPLIDKNLGKKDCLALLEQAGIELPMMYKLGYKNNNCIGCVKGGAGYWNKIRVDFPDVFEKMAKMEEYLGRTVTSISIEGKQTRVTLRQLPPDRGNYQAEPDISCGVFCLQAQDDMDVASGLATRDDLDITFIANTIDKLASAIEREEAQAREVSGYDDGLSYDDDGLSYDDDGLSCDD